MWTSAESPSLSPLPGDAYKEGDREGLAQDLLSVHGQGFYSGENVC